MSSIAFTEANDAFLDMVQYSREDLLDRPPFVAGSHSPEYSGLDRVAHEEALRFGGCTPYEKEFLRSDGTRTPVLVTTAVLKLAPIPVDHLRAGSARSRPYREHRR